jgi:hypothetical protein
VTEPTFSGPAGSVWEVVVPDKPEGHAQLCQWLMFAPTAHPWWRYHVLCVVHLRPLNGDKPHIAFPGASHELLVLAIDPEAEAGIDPDDYRTQARWLTPPDVVVQFIAADDDQARDVARFAAEAVARGLIVPDPDHQTAWEKGIAATAEHIRLGGHPEG